MVPCALILPVRKQGAETWTYFPKLCGDLEMRVMTMNEALPGLFLLLPSPFFSEK